MNWEADPATLGKRLLDHAVRQALCKVPAREWLSGEFQQQHGNSLKWKGVKDPENNGVASYHP